jgi:hypothetical protein
VKRLALLVLLTVPALAHADRSKEPAAQPHKLQREWQVDSRLFAADKDAPEARKGGLDSTQRNAPKLGK